MALKRTQRPYYGKKVRRLEQVAAMAAMEGNPDAAERIYRKIRQHIHAWRTTRALRKGRGYLSRL